MAFKTLREYICEVAFPVGTVYMTKQDITAEQVGLIKGGTWTQLTDCFLVGAGTASDVQGVSNTFTPTTTKAGSNQVGVVPTHYHSVASSGAHGHVTKYFKITKGTGGSDLGRYDGNAWRWDILSTGSAHTHTVNAASISNGLAIGISNVPYTHFIKIFYKTAL